MERCASDISRHHNGRNENRIENNFETQKMFIQRRLCCIAIFTSYLNALSPRSGFLQVLPQVSFRPRHPSAVLLLFCRAIVSCGAF